MVDDLRNHAPTPSEEERSWIEFDPFLFVLKLAAVAVLGIMIGIYASLLSDPDMRSAATVESDR